MRRIWAALSIGCLAAGTLFGATFVVTNTSDDGAGSLRQAILDSNAAFGPDEIDFAIPGSGVHVIALASSLPEITEPVTINGFSQPGSSPNANGVGLGLNAVIQIEIQGTGSGPCLIVGAGNADVFGMLITGLAINGCGTAIWVVSGGDGAAIGGNFIGTDPMGNLSPGAQDYGIDIVHADGILIGGSQPSMRNLISGNLQAGIQIGASGGGSNSLVVGNLIGTDAGGTAAILNGVGVLVSSGTNVRIGGETVDERNVISGNIYGVSLEAGSMQGVVEGNFIGTDVAGTHALGNLTVGIYGTSALIKNNVIAANGVGFGGGGQTTLQGNFIGTDATATLDLGNPGGGILAFDELTVGGTAPELGNVIAHNGGAQVFSGGGAIAVAANVHHVRIRGNRMLDNRPLGIDLMDASTGGVTPNDPGDPDDGANYFQNYPMITSVVSGNSSTHIEGLLNSVDSNTFDVDLYAAACTAFPHDYLQGETYLGSTQVITDAAGNGAFAVDIPYVLEPGQLVTATATDFDGNTSEFSQRIVFSTDPPAGPGSGGTSVFLYGMVYEPGATVMVGGVPATDVQVQDSSSILATMPALPAGSVNDVTVVDSSGVTGTLHNGWVADFLDVPASQQFHEFVVRLAADGVSAGVGGGNFGVNSPTLRQQMAVFLLKAVHGLCYAPPPCSGIFADVPCPSPFADWIEALFHEGITGGCGGDDYCPTDPVRRDQMAVFLIRGEHGSNYDPPPCVGVFDDVPCPSTFADWIEQLVAEQITAGCGGGNYCPALPTTRGQMAVFLTKTFFLP
jgi:hypothetical protein